MSKWFNTNFPTVVGTEYNPDLSGSATASIGSDGLSFLVPATTVADDAMRSIWLYTSAPAQGGVSVDVYDVADLLMRTPPTAVDAVVTPKIGHPPGLSDNGDRFPNDDAVLWWSHDDYPPDPATGKPPADLSARDDSMAKYLNKGYFSTPGPDDYKFWQRYVHRPYFDTGLYEAVFADRADFNVPPLIDGRRIAYLQQWAFIWPIVKPPASGSGSMRVEFFLRPGYSASSTRAGGGTFTTDKGIQAAFGDKVFSAPGGWSWDAAHSSADGVFPRIHWLFNSFRRNALSGLPPVEGRLGIKLIETSAYTDKLLAGWNLNIRNYPEDRKALGEIGPSQIGAVGWREVILTAPGGGVWTKLRNHTYLVVIRQTDASGGGIPGFGYVAGAKSVPGGLGDVPVTFVPESNGVVSGYGAVGKAAIAFAFAKTDNTIREAQPFTLANSSSKTYGFDEIFTGYTIAQELVVGQNSTSFGSIAVQCRLLRDYVAPLRVSLTNSSGVLLNANSYFDITLDDMEQDSPNQFQVVRKTLGALASVTSGTKYRVVLSSTAPQGHGWIPQILRIGYPGPTGLDTGAEAIVVNGSSFFQGTMMGINGTDAPPTPTGVTVAALYPALGPGYVDIGWTSAPPPNFDAFVVWRDNRLIAELTDPTIRHFRDFEAKRAVLSAYTVGVRNKYGAVSIPSAVQQVVVNNNPTSFCGYVFASNWAPALAMQFDDTAPRQWSNPKAAETKVVGLYSGDGRVALKPKEWRGVDFDLTVWIGNFRYPPANQGSFAAFGPAINLFDQQVPYFAVMDSFGNRWFADCTWDQPVWDAEKKSWTMVIHVKELQRVPVSSGVGFVPGP